MKAESRQIPQKLAARLKFVYCPQTPVIFSRLVCAAVYFFHNRELQVVLKYQRPLTRWSKGVVFEETSTKG